jgi:predicted DNA-binding ArsR family transcriptional regulator
MYMNYTFEQYLHKQTTPLDPIVKRQFDYYSNVTVNFLKTLNYGQDIVETARTSSTKKTSCNIL